MSYKTGVNGGVLLSSDMKITELIEVDYSLLSVLMRLDMQLPYGDMSVEELCEKYGISTTMFMTICRIYSGCEYCADTEHIRDNDVKSLIKYLRSSHRLYLGEILPSIRKGVDAVLECCSAKQQAIVKKFYSDYEEEVKAHLQYEEITIFPYVESLVEGVACSGEKMQQLMESHTDICEKIDDIKSILIKYLPEQCTTRMRYDLLLNVYRLSEDLSKHTTLEVRILAPAVCALQKDCRR